jgi:hypothetical protein
VVMLIVACVTGLVYLYIRSNKRKQRKLSQESINSPHINHEEKEMQNAVPIPDPDLIKNPTIFPKGSGN